MSVISRLRGLIGPLSHSRFGIIFLFVAIALINMTWERTALLMRSYTEIEGGLTTMAAIYASGLIYDLALCSYFIIPFVLYLALLPNRLCNHPIHRYLTLLFFTLSLYGLFFVDVAEWLFWDEFSTRFNFIAVDYLVYQTEVTNNINESYPLPLLLSLILIASIVTSYLSRRWLFHSLSAREGLGHRLKVAALLLCTPYAAYALVDQSLHNLSDNSYANELAKNGLYQFFNAFKDSTLDYDRYYVRAAADVAAEQLRAAVAEPNSHFLNQDPFDISRQIETVGDERRMNIMLVTVESLSADLLGTFGSRQGLTPNLDRIASEGLLFSNLYATGTRTTRGLESISLSIPPTPGRSLVKRPDNANLFTLGYVLQQKGYNTQFFYGGRGYFDNMNEFFAGNGYGIIDQSDLEEQEISFENAWGVADEDLYGKAIKEATIANQQGAPFLFHIMTTSNHRPFTYPEGKIDIPSGEGRHGAVKYSDYAIGQFLQLARAEPWFDNTLFIFVADHCAGSAGKAALPIERYHIPLIVYAPSFIEPATIDTLASQIDVAPTLLSLLNMSYISQFFGKDILGMSPEQGRALIGNYQKLGLYSGNRLSFQAPQQGFKLVDDPLGQSVIIDPSRDQPLMQANIAFYQGADTVIKQRLNRHGSSE